MAKKPPPVYQHSPGLAKPAPKPRINPPPILGPGRRPNPGSAYVPHEPGMGTGPGGTGAPDGAGGGGGGGDGAPDIDWASVYFGSYGLPADLINQINELGKKYGTSNPDVFFQSAQNTIRGSDWFKTTYPGFFAGVKAGIFQNEQGYRDYVNNLNGVYKQYTGKVVSSGDVEAALNEGVSTDIVGRRFAGQAYVNANRNDIQYVEGAFDTGQLSESELKAYGQEQAGIDTPLGQQLQRRLNLAQQRLKTVFSGSLATPNLSVGANGLQATSLLGNRASTDVGA